MGPFEETFIEVGGRTFLRTRVTARLQLADDAKVPPQIKAANQARASQLHFNDKSSPDLTWVKLVLDTEGSNGNWDYMPRPALLRNFSTAVFKPFDMDHVILEDKSMVGMNKTNPPVRNTIYGVLTHASISDSKGEPLTDEAMQVLANTDDMHRKDEDKIGVVAWAALYSFLFPKTVAEVTQMIAADEMAVSMERWISSYDFLVPQTGGSCQAVARAEAENNGIFNKWAMRQGVASGPIFRRSLDFVYGGCASTTNPANKLCRFVSPGTVKAAASTGSQDILKFLLQRHDELHARHAIESASGQDEVIREHTNVTRAIAAITGQTRGV